MSQIGRRSFIAGLAAIAVAPAISKLPVKESVVFVDYAAPGSDKTFVLLWEGIGDTYRWVELSSIRHAVLGNERILGVVAKLSHDDEIWFYPGDVVISSGV